MTNLPFEHITCLQARVVTSSDTNAGTDNTVYFDVGPLGWELDKPGSQFERGADETYTLTIPEGLDLTTDDIVWLRLQKKGLGRVLGTPDGPWGGWKPQSVHLLVNKTEWAAAEVNQWLDRTNPFWMKQLRPSWSAGRLFARTTRLVPNEALGYISEGIAALTTPFKLMGISGWLGTVLPPCCAVGTVIRKPGVSTDGLATIDLRLELLNVGSRRYRFGWGGINSPRYLRVEYAFGKGGSESIPKAGQCVRICGTVKWDTDDEGWYEIHPAGPQDVTVLGTNACNPAELVSPGPLSVRAAVAGDFPGTDLRDGLKSLDACLGSPEFSVRSLVESCGSG